MDRLACVDLPAFPLQLLFRRQPTWASRPAAVVAESKPQARLLWVNEPARRAGILPGMRYAAGLSLRGDLHAAAIAPRELDQAVRALAETLRQFSPHVEPAGSRFGIHLAPGLFWLDASGLLGLFPSLQHWGRALRQTLHAQGFTASLAIGFTRFGTYAAARSCPAELVCFASPQAEQQTVQTVPLCRLELDPSARDTFERLGLRQVQDLLALATGDLQERFDPSIAAWQALARDAAFTPLEPLCCPSPVQRSVLFDHSEADSTRLLFLIKRELHAMLEELAGRQELATCLFLRARIDRHERYEEYVRPAAPTRDLAQLIDLLRLRFEGSPLPGEVTEIFLELHGISAQSEQLELFASRPRRDLAAADRALARVRAELGDEAVCRGVLRNGHLPEATFAWQPLGACKRPRLRESHVRQMVRRLYAQPLPLPGLAPSPETLHMPEAHGKGAQRPVRWAGPYLLSGGWWQRLIQREYYFIETRSGSIRWCYHDLERRRWFLHGELE